jgi:hypothetical protein
MRRLLYPRHAQSRRERPVGASRFAFLNDPRSPISEPTETCLEANCSSPVLTISPVARGQNSLRNRQRTQEKEPT